MTLHMLVYPGAADRFMGYGLRAVSGEPGDEPDTGKTIDSPQVEA